METLSEPTSSPAEMHLAQLATQIEAIQRQLDRREIRGPLRLVAMASIDELNKEYREVLHSISCTQKNNASKINPGKALAKLDRVVQTTVSELSRQCITIYTKSNPPQDIASAEKRRDELRETVTNLLGTLTMINREFGEIFKPKTLNLRIACLRGMITKVNEELTFLRKYIRTKRHF